MNNHVNIIGMHQLFYDFWMRTRNEDGCVEDGKIDPNDLKPLLSNLVKIRNTPEGPQYTIVGTQIVEEYRQDFTGFLVAEHPHEICRTTYQSMIERMNSSSSLINCYGYFCYTHRNYLRTMETGFALCDGNGDITGYLVLVTVDHDHYFEKLYQPVNPMSVAAREADIESQNDFNSTMKLYRQLSV